MDIGFALYGILTSFSLYALAIACLTATVRMESISNIVFDKYLRFPFYSWISGLRKNSRIFLIFTHVLFLQYGMLFRGHYYDSRKHEYIGGEFSEGQKTLLYWLMFAAIVEFLNQLYIICMIAVVLAC